jgi:hypothetical protein
MRFGGISGAVPVSPQWTNGTMTEPECLDWGEACLWWLDLKMARGRGGEGGDTVRLGLGQKGDRLDG